MVQFSFAYNRLRESFMAFTHSHSYDAFQEWYNGDMPFINEACSYYGNCFSGAIYGPMGPTEVQAEQEWEAFLLRTARTFQTLALCTDWHKSVPYFYENMGDPDVTLDHFFPELAAAIRANEEEEKEAFPF